MNRLSIARAATVVFASLIGAVAYSGVCQSVRGTEQNGQDMPTQHVKVIVARCLARDYSAVNMQAPDGHKVKGVTRISWVPPETEDYREMESIGPDAVKPLSGLLDYSDKDGLVQLLAVKFLVGIGGVSVVQPLVRATKKDQWQVVRFAAMEELAASPNAETMAVIKALQTDADPAIAKEAREILERPSQSYSK
jgi:HEAT repeats